MFGISAIFTATFLVITLSCGPVLGQIWEQYSPLTKSERGKPFSMKRIELGQDRVPVSLTLPAGPSGTHLDIERQDGALSLHSAFGKDSDHHDWRVELEFEACGFPSDFYVGDLDGNGINDLALLVPTCGNGLAPTVHLFSLLFDEKGRPVPFEADGYFEPLPNGVDALVDMNDDGKAELIYMNYDDGYWITNIYRCENARWHRVEGQFAKRKYPLFTRFTKKSNRKAVVPKPDRHPFAPDLSNDIPVSKGNIDSFFFPEKTWSDVEVNFTDSEGTKIKCTPAYWFGSARVIHDKPDGRQICYLTQENKQKISVILNTIISKRSKVSLYGKRYQDKCSPEIVWATENK